MKSGQVIVINKIILFGWNSGSLGYEVTTKKYCVILLLMKAYTVHTHAPMTFRSAEENYQLNSYHPATLTPILFVVYVQVVQILVR
jgi:hypothetical protein